MFRWLHHLFDPHCPDCHHDRVEKNSCKSCETLRSLLEQANYEKGQLLKTLLELSNPKVEPVEYKPQEMKPAARSNYMPFRIQREMLEREDREAARIRKAHKETPAEAIAALEKELEIPDAVGPSNAQVQTW